MVAFDISGMVLYMKENDTQGATEEIKELNSAIVLFERLPLEVLELIAKFCSHSMLWRYGATLEGGRASWVNQAMDRGLRLRVKALRDQLKS